MGDAHARDARPPETFRGEGTRAEMTTTIGEARETTTGDEATTGAATATEDRRTRV